VILAAGSAFRQQRINSLDWGGADLVVDHPLDYLGQDGGAGIGSGPGMAVGAALALEGSGRLPVAVLGDGDFLMGGTVDDRDTPAPQLQRPAWRQDRDVITD
jgi:Thiamine pyrophosphate enzyme, C-terminal TPP binding domain